MKKLAQNLSLSLGLVALAVAQPAAADDAPPPKAATGGVYAGNCVSPAINALMKAEKHNEGGFLASLLTSVGTTLLGQGFDWIGAQITKLAQDQRTDIFGARTSEAPFNDHYCVQVVRFAASGQPLNALVNPLAPAEWAAKERLPPAPPMDRPVDFFAEYWIRPSDDGSAVALVPTLLYYPKLLNAHGSNDAARVVKAALGGGSDAASATWSLPAATATDPKMQALLALRPLDGGKLYRWTPDQLRETCETACEGSSPWLANPWQGAKAAPQKPAHTPPPTKPDAAAAPAPAEEKPAAAGAKGKGKGKAEPAAPAAAAAPPPQPVVAAVAPAAPGAAPATGPSYGSADYASKPVNVQLTWTEIRDGSAFWKSVAALWTAEKPALQAQAEQLLFSAQREKAKTDAMTASSQALDTFATKMDEAEAARVNTYCPAKDNPKANWTSLSASLRAKQLAANVAASAAAQPMPFTPIEVTGAYDATACPA
jgi:hypothetical protein